jgi:hypothetical protein
LTPSGRKFEIEKVVYSVDFVADWRRFVSVLVEAVNIPNTATVSLTNIFHYMFDYAGLACVHMVAAKAHRFCAQVYPLDLSFSSPADVPDSVAADRHYAGLPPFDIASGAPVPPPVPSPVPPPPPPCAARTDGCNKAHPAAVVAAFFAT